MLITNYLFTAIDHCHISKIFSPSYWLRLVSNVIAHTVLSGYILSVFSVYANLTLHVPFKSQPLKVLYFESRKWFLPVQYFCSLLHNSSLWDCNGKFIPLDILKPFHPPPNPTSGKHESVLCIYGLFFIRIIYFWFEINIKSIYGIICIFS